MPKKLELEVKLADGLVIGPDEILVIKLDDENLYEEDMIEMFQETLRQMGIEDRTMIIWGADIELAKMEAKDADR